LSQKTKRKKETNMTRTRWIAGAITAGLLLASNAGWAANKSAARTAQVAAQKQQIVKQLDAVDSQIAAVAVKDELTQSWVNTLTSMSKDVRQMVSKNQMLVAQTMTTLLQQLAANPPGASRTEVNQ